MSRLPDNAAGKRKGISYAKWGYLFIAPFFIIYAIFNLYPLALTSTTASLKTTAPV